MKLLKKMKWIAAAVVVLVGIGILWNLGDYSGREALAASSQRETVKLRVIGTTDLHGQLNSKDYEQGVDYSNGGLARLSDLVKKTKSEMPAESIITLDAGDTLFDYTTEYIFAENQQVIQPIYQAMAKIGYDAITLGNHDFDYGYEYILRQLDGSGLRDITVVSNVMDSKTGDYPFLENMLITRTLTSSAGNKIEVKIGIIGQTIPTLTSKTHSYTGILKTEDMVENAKAQAKKLKELGADVIIALSHTGIGPEKPELNFKNVAYALTKIEDIDVVVCGHEHNLFPTTDMTSPYFQLPNVDRKTFLMNGKNVIMAGNRGSALGVVDLTLTVYKDTLRISDRSSELRMVTEKSTKENKEIASSFGSWEEKLLSYSTDIIAKLKDGELIHNFFGMLGDNTAIQLLNDAKIDYAKRFAQTTGLQYANYPVIAASTYMAYGAANSSDFINIHDDVTESDLSAIQPYNNYIYLYTITGKQLKEWLEWSASAYETTMNGSKWNAGTMSDLMKENGIKSLLREDWLDDWSSFYVFDGINYIIDPFSEPRYDLGGNRISMGERITSLTHNGKPVTDDMVFLLASNKITKPTAANKGVEKQVALNGFNRTQTILSKYIRQLRDDGNVIPQVDYNWRVNITQDKSFIVKVPSLGKELFQKTAWYKSFLKDSDQYSYFTASYPSIGEDQVAPHIIATPVITSATASPYKVAVQVTDRSEITKIRYTTGEAELEVFTKGGGMTLDSNNTFTISKNGSYTIYAEDSAGNKASYLLTVNNFRDDLLSSPTIDSYTNRKTKISGRGEPNATIVFEAYTGTYESKITKDGTFSYALPAQPSGTVVSVYLKNEKGLESARVNVTVKRTGPNMPSINPVINTNGYISGDLNDDDASPIAVIGDTVYVPEKGGKALYEKSTEIYNASLKIVEVGYERDELGYFTLLVPPQLGGADVTVYSLDHLSRNSRVYKSKVVEVGPNAPFVYEVSNIERTIYGYVPTSKSIQYTVTIALGKASYTVKTDTKGNFSYQFAEQLHAGDIIAITACEDKYGSARDSYTTELKVRNIEEFVKTASEQLTLNRVTDKSYLVSGTYADEGEVYLAITTGSGKNFKSTLYIVNTEGAGRFKQRLQDKLEAGSMVYAMIRFEGGNIYTAAKTEVQAGRPDMPILVKEISNTDKTAQIIAKKGSEVVLTIGTKEYTADVSEYDAENNRYIYTFQIDRSPSGTMIKAIARNMVGTSDTLTTAVTKAAPDQPKVDEVKSGATKITGKIELLDYTAPVENKAEEKANKEEEIPERFKDAPEKVAKTQTRIYAQIGKKYYEGSITNSGKFTIKIPKQKSGTEIILFGMNKAGRGPLVKVKVK
jgi:2',3'-cyclic-nucleotide 2'-phosphodiesterase / 3'-nucleotidase / 5'-nucleotidase